MTKGCEGQFLETPCILNYYYYDCIQTISEDPALLEAARQQCQTYFDSIAVVNACLSYNVSSLGTSMDNCIDDIVVRFHVPLFTPLIAAKAGGMGCLGHWTISMST